VTAPFSLLITARDEEELLPAALASAADWAAETVVVVDPATVDSTREIAAAAGARVLEHHYVSSGTQCNWGIAQCDHDLVFVLDADERLTPRLRASVAAAVAAPDVAAWAVDRLNLAFSRPLRHGDWGHDRIIRLLDRRHARYDEAAVHASVRASSIGHLSGRLEHLTLRSFDQYVPKMHDYARRGALDLLAGGRRPRIILAIAHAEWKFARSFLLRGGFLDGVPGLVVSLLLAYGTFLKWAWAWDLARSRQA